MGSESYSFSRRRKRHAARCSCRPWMVLEAVARFLLPCKDSLNPVQRCNYSLSIGLEPVMQELLQDSILWSSSRKIINHVFEGVPELLGPKDKYSLFRTCHRTVFFGVLQPLCLRKDPNLGRFGLEVFVCDSEQADETGNQLFILQMPLVAHISCNDAVRGKKADDISRCFGVVLWHLDQIVNPPLETGCRPGT